LSPAFGKYSNSIKFLIYWVNTKVDKYLNWNHIVGQCTWTPKSDFNKIFPSTTSLFQNLYKELGQSGLFADVLFLQNFCLRFLFKTERKQKNMVFICMFSLDNNGKHWNKKYLQVHYSQIFNMVKFFHFILFFFFLAEIDVYVRHLWRWQ
jgi:hypothetical protein